MARLIQGSALGLRQIRAPGKWIDQDLVLHDCEHAVPLNIVDQNQPLKVGVG
ncbi:MAG: hypothetical protein WCK64_05505 [Synechococcaceae cyanobacterium ELA445]